MKAPVMVRPEIAVSNSTIKSAYRLKIGKQKLSHNRPTSVAISPKSRPGFLEFRSETPHESELEAAVREVMSMETYENQVQMRSSLSGWGEPQASLYPSPSVP